MTHVINEIKQGKRAEKCSGRLPTLVTMLVTTRARKIPSIPSNATCTPQLNDATSWPPNGNSAEVQIDLIYLRKM